MENQELWKDIEDFERLYHVSTKGRIKSFKNSIPKILSPAINAHGYCRLVLSNHKKQKKEVQVHRLVALAFIPNPENKPEVNHKWGNKQDNRACALEWATTSENLLHAIKFGLKVYKEDNGKAKIIR